MILLVRHLVSCIVSAHVDMPMRSVSIPACCAGIYFDPDSAAI